MENTEFTESFTTLLNFLKESPVFVFLQHGLFLNLGTNQEVRFKVAYEENNVQNILLKDFPVDFPTLLAPGKAGGYPIQAELVMKLIVFWNAQAMALKLSGQILDE